LNVQVEAYIEVKKHLIEKLQEFILSLGPFYLRVVVGSIVLMMIGLVLFSVGYYVIGHGVVLLPGRQYVYSSYYESIEYVPSTIETIPASLSTVPTDITVVDLKSPGYINIELSSSEYISVRFDIIDRSTNQLVYAVVIDSGEKTVIPIYNPGEYRITASLSSGPTIYVIPANIRVEVFIAKEATPIIVARWFQLTGLSLLGIGFLILLFSYRIATKTAEAEYYIPPSELREEIASQSYLRIFTPRILGEEEEEEE